MSPEDSLKKESSPILKGDHPELYDMEFISEEDKVKYISMIGTAQSNRFGWFRVVVPSRGSESWFRVTCSVPNARKMPGQV